MRVVRALRVFYVAPDFPVAGPATREVMPTAEVLREIRRASRPHGVATIDAFRLTPRQLQRACSAGALDRPHPGVYVDPAVPRTALKDLAVAVAAGGPTAAAWGRSAAALWGLIDEHPSLPEIVVPNRRYARIRGVIVHRSVDLCWDHLILHRRIQVTRPLITVLDAGVVMSALDVADMIIRGRQLRLVEIAGVEATIAKLGRPGRTGTRVARDALGLVMIGDRPAETALELRFALGPGAHGLPPYEYQHQLVIDGRDVHIDFAYPSVMLAIEVDGYESRRSRDALDYGNRRQNKLTRLGWTVLRFTWDRVCGDPAGVAAEILAVLCSLGYRFGR
jgi:very-short-patch-repair endonuclease